MRLRPLALAALPLIAVSSCLLPSFSNVDAPASGGGAGRGGRGGEAGEAGEAVVAGEGGESGATNEAAQLVDDVYTVVQGSTLSVRAPGVLENDAGAGLVVVATDDNSTTRPPSYDATTLQVAADGALEFEPQADFFGSYRVQYTVEDGSGQRSTASVTIHVQPSAAKLAAVRDGIGGFVIDGAAKDALGSAISGAGDVNHDGFDDVLIGAEAAGNAGAGRAYVVYGRARATNVTLQALPAKSSERAFSDFEGAAGDGLGNAVAAIGDLNGDGFSDFAIAATGAAPAGAVYVLFGGALSGGYNLGGLTRARGVRLTGASAPIGDLISRAGDVNGDGVPDLLVSGASNNGRVYAVLGSPALKDSPIDDLPGLLSVEGGTMNESLPLSMDAVGKLAEGDKDAVVLASQSGVVVLRGASTAYPVDTKKASLQDAEALSYPLLKATSPQVHVAGTANVDGDAAGVDDIMICELLASGGQCRVLFNSSAANPWSISGFVGLPQLAHGADLNGDGFSDLLFGDESSAYAVFGKKGAHGAVDVSSLAAAGFSLQAEAGAPIDAVATLGDVNGDGLADYAVGSSAAHAGSGTVYVVFGEQY